MTGLDALLKTSLIGTEKLPLTLESLPVVIKDVIAKKNDDAEEIVLRSAAMVFFYNQTGALPQKLADNHFEKIVETKTPARSVVTQLLQTIETTGYYEKEYLYNLWLDKVIQRNEIVTSAFIMPLINAGISFTKATKSKIIQVIGETGKLIIPLKPDFKVKGLQLEQHEDVWKEGNSAERKLFLEELIQTNTGAALDLIEKDWPLEPITFKKSILEIIIQHTDPAILTFLEKLYNEEFVYAVNEKPTVTQCRFLTVKALLFNEQSNLFIKTKEQIAAYCEVAKKGILGKLVSGSNKIKVNLPGEKDNFFNAENIKATFGIEPLNSNPAYFEKDTVYWFAELLAILPVQMWIQLFDTNEKEVFRYFLENNHFEVTIHGQKENIFYKAIQENLQYSKNQKLIMQLVELNKEHTNYELVSFLKRNNFEAFAVKNSLLTDANYMYFYGKNNPDWSQEFSMKLINETYKEMVEKQQPVNDVLRNMIGKFICEGAKPVLDNLFLKNDTSAFKELWIEQIYKPVKKVIEIKQQIKQL